MFFQSSAPLYPETYQKTDQEKEAIIHLWLSIIRKRPWKSQFFIFFKHPAAKTGKMQIWCLHCTQSTHNFTDVRADEHTGRVLLIMNM